MGLISMNMESTILQIPIEDIIPNRFQPRLNFDDEALQELANSIKEHGIIQPLVLRKLGDKYEIIAGERRYKASQIAGLTTVPAVISNIDDEKSAEVALVENIQRKNLTSIEEAKSYKNILDRGYLTQEQLAEKLGISQSTIANKLRLLNLCDEVQDALLKEKISERHARALLAIKDPTEQIKWLNKIINDRLTVRQLDIEIKKSLKTNPDDDDSNIPLVELTPNIQEIKENALDIHPQEGLHDIESMLKPSAAGEKTFDLSNPVDEVETLDIDDDSTSSDSLGVNNTPPNTFFNFLEDESANMSEEASIDDFEFQLNKMSVSGALFDMVKLLDVSKIVISRLTAEEVYNKSYEWAQKYDKDLVNLLEDKEYSLKVLGIERGNQKPRKDIAKWSDVKENIEYMYDDKFFIKNHNYEYQVINDKKDINKILNLYMTKYYDENDDKQTWFDKIKELAGEMGYAKEVKEFKANPDIYKAHVGDVSTVLRIALTGRANTPDMYEIMQVLGKTSIYKRLEKAMEE